MRFKGVKRMLLFIELVELAGVEPAFKLMYLYEK